MPKSPWTDDIIDAAKRLWRDGYSASVIVGKMNGIFSRNALIGKASRDCWDGGNKQIRLPSRRRQPIISAVRHPPKRIGIVPRKRGELLPKAPPGGVSFFDLRSRHCRWPLWDSDARLCGNYCGREVFRDGAVYCRDHAKKAYRHR